MFFSFNCLQNSLIGSVPIVVKIYLSANQQKRQHDFQGMVLHTCQQSMEIDLPVDLLMKVLERFLLFGAGIVPSPCWIKKVFSDVDGIVDKVSTFRFECCITCHYLTFHR